MNGADFSIFIGVHGNAGERNLGGGFALILKTEDEDVRAEIRRNFGQLQMQRFSNIEIVGNVVSGIGKAAGGEETSLGELYLSAVFHAVDMAAAIVGNIVADKSVEIVFPETAAQYKKVFKVMIDEWAKGNFKKPTNHNNLVRSIYANLVRLRYLSNVKFDARQNESGLLAETLAKIQTEIILSKT